MVSPTLQFCYVVSPTWSLIRRLSNFPKNSRKNFGKIFSRSNITLALRVSKSSRKNFGKISPESKLRAHPGDALKILEKILEKFRREVTLSGVLRSLFIDPDFDRVRIDGSCIVEKIFWAHLCA